MDYLTVFATRSLILFTPQPLPRPLAPLQASPSSTTAELQHTPTPVAMPIQSLVQSDTNCAYFLLQHVISSCCFTGSEREQCYRSIGSLNKDTFQKAEVLVWEQIDRAKLFARELGLWFKSASEISEKELKGLAAAHGIDLATPSRVEDITDV